MERVEDHNADGAALLIDQYQGKPRLGALLASYLNRCQEFEDALWEVYDSRLLDNAVGVQLDTLGKLVGQQRVSDDDAAYRLYIRTRIRANRSRGLIQDVIAVSSLALDGIPFTFREMYPASIIIEATEPVTEFAAFIFDVLNATKSGGVALSFHYSALEFDETFAFASGDAEESDTARGFGDVADTVGGRMIAAF